MDRIYLSKDINSVWSKIPNDILNKSLIIWHEMYDKPSIGNVIEWDKYRSIYQKKEASHIILVGLNRMINPSNRCDFIHDYLTTLTPNIPKISIDTAPYIGEPWRLFFHYLFTHTNKFGYSYSYPIEGEWKKWFYKETNDCRLSSDNLGLFINSTYSDLISLDTKYLYENPTQEQLNWYEEIKAHVLSKYTSPKMWINTLMGECNKKFNIKINFESYLSGKTIKAPDIGIYRFIIEENQRRQNIYNKFCK